MIHHVSLGSNDIAKARAFYDPLMSLIGFPVLKASTIAAHYGASDIVFSLETPVDGNPASPGNGVHVAFQAPDRETVRRFMLRRWNMVGRTRTRQAFAPITMPAIRGLRAPSSCCAVTLVG
jgi:catechol 2,3-dioxygenase-like lactoylglutathione lyase family enzyme